MDYWEIEKRWIKAVSVIDELVVEAVKLGRFLDAEMRKLPKELTFPKAIQQLPLEECGRTPEQAECALTMWSQFRDEGKISRVRDMAAGVWGKEMWGIEETVEDIQNLIEEGLLPYKT